MKATKNKVGRPPAPLKMERLAMLTTLVNEGASFDAAARAGLSVYELAGDKARWILQTDTMARLPKSPEGRPASMRRVRAELLAPWTDNSTPPTLCGRPLPVPIAFVVHRELNPGRPKKIRCR